MDTPAPIQAIAAADILPPDPRLPVAAAARRSPEKPPPPPWRRPPLARLVPMSRAD
jgi:hypothetical protein